MLSPNARISKRQDLLTSEIDGKIVLLGVDSGKYFAFDDISTDIWNRLDSQPFLLDLCKALANDYDADPKTIHMDVCKVLAMLAENHLIDITD